MRRVPRRMPNLSPMTNSDSMSDSHAALPTDETDYVAAPPAEPVKRRNWGATAGRVARRSIVPAIFFVLGGVVALLGERLIGVGEGEGETRVMTFDDWRLVCPPATTENAQCSLTQEVVRDQGGTLLVMLSMNNPALGSNLSVTVPHGVLLDPGLGFSSGDESPKVRPYETCTPLGCVAHVPMDAATLKSLQENTRGQVLVVPGNGAPVTIPFSLRGFAQGYAELAREQARRNSIWGFLAR